MRTSQKIKMKKENGLSVRQRKVMTANEERKACAMIGLSVSHEYGFVFCLRWGEKITLGLLWTRRYPLNIQLDFDIYSKMCLNWTVDITTRYYGTRRLDALFNLCCLV